MVKKRCIKFFIMLVAQYLVFSHVAEATLVFPVKLDLQKKEVETVEFDVIVEASEVIDHKIGSPTILTVKFVDKNGEPFYPYKMLTESAIWRGRGVSKVVYRPQISITATQSYESRYGIVGTHWRAVSISVPLNDETHSCEINLDSFWNRESSIRSMYGHHGKLRDAQNLIDRDSRSLGYDIWLKKFKKSIPVTLEITYGASGPFIRHKEFVKELVEMIGHTEQ